MKINEKATIAAALAGVATAVGAGALVYIDVVRTERMKRKKIEEHKLDALACIRNFETKMIKLAEDPNVDAATYLQEFAVESRFLNIVTDQLRP